jgi:hypothetical protein
MSHTFMPPRKSPAASRLPSRLMDTEVKKPKPEKELIAVLVPKSRTLMIR